MNTNQQAHIVVGVVPGQPDAVVLQAAMFATHFNAVLVCVSVDARRYTVSDGIDGTVTSFPFGPDLTDLREKEFDPDMRDHLGSILDATGVTWTTRALAGDPAPALGQLAETLGAVMIVVGTKEATVRGSLQEFFNGSVAVHLAHHQHRPVVVIPLTPVPFNDALPWEPA